MSSPESRKPLCTTVPEYFMLPDYGLGERLAIVLHSSIMGSVRSFELDDNCMLTTRIDDSHLFFRPTNRLAHIRISFWNFDQCIYLLSQLGSQLHSFTVTIGWISTFESDIISKIRSVRYISRFDI
jgi:hypothetical protein